MKKLLFLITLIGLGFYTSAQNFAWAKRMGGAGFDYGTSVVVNADGSVYTTGYFEGTADFDSGTGVFNLTSVGGSDIFVSKLDALGNFVWAKRMGGINTDEGISIVLDNSGNVYTTGYFSGTADFDPGAGVVNLTSTGVQAIFVSKLDASGNFVWAKSMGGTSNSGGRSITVDTSRNIYTTGYFSGTVDFDPGTGVVNLTSAGNREIFVSKLDASGNFVWAKKMGELNSDEGISIVVDVSRNVYTSGYFYGTVDFDPGVGTTNLVSAGSADVFVSKLDTSGNFVWAKRMGGTGMDYGNSIAIDTSGNVYTTGYFSGTADFDPGTGVVNFTSAGSADIFVSKLDASGNFVWAKNMRGTIDGGGRGIAIDTSGNVYTAGYFYGTVDFDPGADTVNLTSAGSADIFVSKLDASGNFMWVKPMGGTGDDQGYSIALDTYGNVYTTGYFSGTADFDPGAGIVNLTSAGIWVDIFVSKLSCSSATTVVQTACDSLTWIDGNTYTVSTNTPTFILPNVAGCDSTITLDLTINNLIASYTSIDNGNGNHTFTNTSTGSFNKTHWAFGDGTTSTAANPNHTFSANGTYVVVLTVNDSIGSSCMDYYLDTIVVTGVVAPLQCAAGFVMYPDAGGIVLVNSSTGTNLTYLWDFGDGDTSNAQFPSHTYAASGPYYLCLTVDDGVGCVDMYCDSIGENGVVFSKQTGFTINVIAPPLVTQVSEQAVIISAMSIYPNPTGKKLNVVFNKSEPYQLKIVTIDGKLIETKTIVGNTTLDVSNYSSGMYFITATNNEGKVYQSKFVKE